jgi:hypothetical protein
MDSFADRVIFQTRAWLRFVAETQKGEPVVAEISDGANLAGYFSGVVVRRLGVRILGSSFPGWTTPYMGFNLLPGVSRASLLQSLVRWAFDDLKCLHIEVSDLNFSSEDGHSVGLNQTAYLSYRTDLTRSEDELFDNMSSACRRCIRKALNNGVVIDEADDDGFALEYYEQLKDVFAKQGKTPTYGVNRVRSLIKCLKPTGNLLLLRARSQDGACIGTGIYPGMNKTAEFWGNASWREHQHLRPNESLHWYAMRYWKRRGATMFDWGGGGEYKEKYGVERLCVPWFYQSRYRCVSTARDSLRSLYYSARHLSGALHGRRHAIDQQ